MAFSHLIDGRVKRGQSLVIHYPATWRQKGGMNTVRIRLHSSDEASQMKAWLLASYTVTMGTTMPTKTTCNAPPRISSRPLFTKR